MAFFGLTTNLYVMRSLQKNRDSSEVITAMGLITDYLPESVTIEDGPNPSPLIDGQSVLDRIRERGAVRVGYLTDNLPFSYTNSDGDLTS